MPQRVAKKKPVAPVAPTPPLAPVAALSTPVKPDRPVIYDKLEIRECSTASPHGPLTCTQVEKMLGWENEEQYLARMLAENPGVPPEQWMADPKKKEVFGDIYHCKDRYGKKIRCRHNAHNRPLDEAWCEELVHTVLYGQWAGPFTVPGETVNGETVRISRYGEVLTAQHQGTALLLAKQDLEMDRQKGLDHPDKPKYPIWRNHPEPFLETIVITGMSDDPRILMTIDYVRPRTAADVFYTADTFRSSPPPARKELCRMLAIAVDMLWTRTDTRGYKTHPEVVAFLERHKSLLKCVQHLFANNASDSSGAGRKISKLRLAPGQCAALMFLMACSGATDPEYGDVYRNENPAPSERSLDWSLWDRAEEFWTFLAGGVDFEPVRTALDLLRDSFINSEENQGLGGRAPEKLALLSRAWERWKDYDGGTPFDESDLQDGGQLCLSYNDLDDKGNKLPPLPDGRPQLKLLDTADFLGIDAPAGAGKNSKTAATQKADPPAPTPAEIQKAMDDAAERRRKSK